MSEREHVWVIDRATSDFGNMRYDCACGARARRKRPKLISGVVQPGSEIMEVKPGSRWDKPHRPMLQEPKGTVGNKAGKNATGHFLPPSSGSKRR